MLGKEYVGLWITAVQVPICDGDKPQMSESNQQQNSLNS